MNVRRIAGVALACAMVTVPPASTTPAAEHLTELAFSDSTYALWTVTARVDTSVQVIADLLTLENTTSMGWLVHLSQPRLLSAPWRSYSPRAVGRISDLLVGSTEGRTAASCGQATMGFAFWVWKSGEAPARYSFITITMGSHRVHIAGPGIPLTVNAREVPECTINDVLTSMIGEIPGVLQRCSMGVGPTIPQAMKQGEQWRILVVLGTDGLVEGHLQLLAPSAEVNDLRVGQARYEEEEAFSGGISVLAGIGNPASPALVVIQDCALHATLHRTFGFFWGTRQTFGDLAISYDSSEGHHAAQLLYPFVDVTGDYTFRIDRDIGYATPITPFGNDVRLLLADVDLAS